MVLSRLRVRREAYLLPLVLVATLSLCATGAGAADGDPQRDPHASAFLVLLTPAREPFPDVLTDEEKVALEAHREYMAEGAAKGIVLMGGPSMGPPRRGIGIMAAESREALDAYLAADPGVAGGIFTVEVSEFLIAVRAEEGAQEMVQHEEQSGHAEATTPRILRKEVTVRATPDAVWHAWTTTEGTKSFFGRDADVELKIGGKYEQYFLLEGEPGKRGSEGCTVLSYLPNEMLSFSWNAPPHFGPLRDIHTHVVVQMEPAGEGAVRVRLTHLGFGEGDDWKAVHDYFDAAWDRVLSSLQKSLESSASADETPSAQP